MTREKRPCAPFPHGDPVLNFRFLAQGNAGLLTRPITLRTPRYLAYLVSGLLAKTVLCQLLCFAAVMASPKCHSASVRVGRYSHDGSSAEPFIAIGVVFRL